jgi:alcohol dehydrogenase
MRWLNGRMATSVAVKVMGGSLAMRQLFFVSPNVLEWQDVPAPRLQSDTDALIKPLVVTRCDLDMYIANGSVGMPGPFAFGHETYGQVVDVGEKLKNVRPGDRVLVPFQISCGSCGRCREGLTGLCETVPYRSSYGMAPLSGVDYGGGLSDLLRVPFADHMLVHAPNELQPEAMAGVTDNVTTALMLVADPLHRKPGASILVVGGRGRGVGLHVVQCAIGLGAQKVVYVDNDKRTLELAKRAGAEAIELSIGPDTPSLGTFPFTIDVSGLADGLALAIRCTEYEGLCQRSYGDFKERTDVPLRDMYARNITLKIGRVHARAHMHQTLELMKCGCLHPEHIITRRVKFDEAPQAMLDTTNKLVLFA